MDRFVEDVAERTLPHNLEAERSVLGAILVHADNFHTASETITASDFFRDAHSRLFDGMATLVAAGIPPDYVLLKEEMSRRGELDDVGGPVYIASLGDGVPRATNVEYYARVVKEKALLRELIYAANRVTTEAYDATLQPGAIVERAMREIQNIADVRTGGLIVADQAIVEYVQALDSGGLGEPLPTGYRDLDELTGGFKPGDLVFVAARPSVGKTAFVLGATDHMADKGHPGVFFSLEMTRHGISGRLLSRRARVPMTLLERKTATDAQWQRVANAMAAPPVPLYIEDTARTVTEIGAWCRKATQVEEKPLAFVAVDYIQLLTADRRRDSDEAEMSGISKSLKRLAKDLKTVVIVLSQLSRAPESRKDKRPQASDLRGSGALEQDSDMTILLFREEMYGETETNSGIAEVILAKNRNGAVGVVKMAFLKDIGVFADLAVG